MIKPLHDGVLIETIKEKEDPNGIILPDSAKKKPKVAIIKEIGPRVRYCAKGDKVLFDAGYFEEMDGFLLGSEDGILAKVS